MLTQLLRRAACSGRAALHARRRRLVAVTKPGAPAPLTGALADLVRSKPELVAENALLRQQLLVLRRSVKRPDVIREPRAFHATRVEGLGTFSMGQDTIVVTPLRAKPADQTYPLPWTQQTVHYAAA